MLALDHPNLDQESDLAAMIKQANVFFTVLFTIEAVAKINAYDPLDVEYGYFTQPLNLLDLVLVISSLVSLCPEMSPVAFLRILRVFRPLRLLKHVPGMKVIFVFLYEASGEIMDVVGVVLFCHGLFAVIGMELFMGSFGSCTDHTITSKALCVPPSPPGPLVSPSSSLSFDTGALLPPPPPSLSDLLTSSSPPLPAFLPASALPLSDDEEQLDEVEAGRRRRLALGGRVASAPGRRLKGGGGQAVREGQVEGGVAAAPVVRRWMNPAWGSFDDFGNAVLLLFVAATADGWDMFMFQGMDAVGEGLAPVRNDFSAAALFFIIWLVLGCFTMMNLFVGAVCDNFQRIRAEQDGSALLTDQQKQWMRTMQEALQLKQRVVDEKKLKAPSTGACCGLRRACFALVNSESFDLSMTGVIIANVLVMMVQYHRFEEDELFYYYYKSTNDAILLIYYGECVLKLTGLGPAQYFESSWNTFDFFLVAMSLLDTFGTVFLPIPPMFLRIVRLARILRIMRLLKRFKRLRDLIKTTFLSFPSLINIGTLLGVVTFIYAVLGVQIFWNVLPGDELNEQRNFRTMGSATLLLVQCLTGDGWSTLMRDAAAGPERGCHPDAIPTDCGNSASYPYFLSFMFIGTFVLLNLVVAVILDHFSALSNVNPDLVSASDITDFGELWAVTWVDNVVNFADNIDPPSMSELDEPSLVKLLLQQPPPLGVQGQTDEVGARHVISTLRLTRDEGGNVGFQNVLDELVRRSFEGQLGDFGNGAAYGTPRSLVPGSESPKAKKADARAYDSNDSPSPAPARVAVLGAVVPPTPELPSPWTPAVRQKSSLPQQTEADLPKAIQLPPPAPPPALAPAPPPPAPLVVPPSVPSPALPPALPPAPLFAPAKPAAPSPAPASAPKPESKFRDISRGTRTAMPTTPAAATPAPMEKKNSIAGRWPPSAPSA